MPTVAGIIPRKSIQSQLSDQQLFDLCREYGSRALEWRRKFIGLLPEVNRRELWRARGFGSIFEFAARLAGVSEEQVRRALNLELRFRDNPELHASLTEGKISINKLVHLAPVATAENTSFLLAQAEILSTRALQTLAKDEKTLQSCVDVNTNPLQSQIYAKIELKPATAARLKDLQGRGIDLDQLINEMLDQRERNLDAEKAKIVAAETAHENRPLCNTKSRPGRYIPVIIRKILQKEHGTKCSIPHCHRTAVTIHHTRRFALSPSHNPHYLAPLCREHHQIAHSIDRQFQSVRTVSIMGAG